MSLSGISLYALKNEMKEQLIGARVDKIYQENKDLIFYLRNNRQNFVLYFCFSADNPAFYVTDKKFDNPKEPPMFTMLLRKYLLNSKIVDFRQIGLDRVVSIDFETSSDVFELDTVSLNFEMMGKYSNLILYNPEYNTIIDALIRVYPDMSSIRLVTPKENYTLPISEKENILKLDKSEIYAIFDKNNIEPLSKAIYKYLEGFSPDDAMDIMYRLQIDDKVNFSSCNDHEKHAIVDEILKIKEKIENNDFTPTVIFNGDKPSKILAFNTLRPVKQKSFETMNEAVRFFYEKKAFIKLQSSRIHELEKSLKKKIESLNKALENNEKDLIRAQDRDNIKLTADLLAANIYKIKKGDNKIVVNNFYSVNNEQIEIKLANELSPKQNVERLYKKYTKLKHAEEFLKNRIPKLQNEIYYLESVIVNLHQSETLLELNAIRDELIKGGYIKTNTKKKIKSPKVSFREFVSPNGFKILAGRNNIQNDELTNKLAHKSDLWFHLRNEPGTHVILKSANKKYTDDDIMYAASIAAALSGKTTKSDVDYAEVKYVKKIPGAKPGLVTYKNFKTVTVEPLNFKK
ncbi:MAG: NFACT family protein [Ezakiella sp.]|nr:NFACT family protein [Ezakiella sp.]MDD7471768.1 NFACT RNA binding domain-containing protein [Bacillota bacterium]MDY3923520.1 NFACT RNA binding domain-containing protein [Ezakiella sp.]